MKNLIFKETGLLPSVYENGTHYVVNMRLTLELLKVISESEEVIVKLSGDYTGGISGGRNRENTTGIGFISIRSTNGGTNLW